MSDIPEGNIPELVRSLEASATLSAPLETRRWRSADLFFFLAFAGMWLLLAPLVAYAGYAVLRPIMGWQVHTQVLPEVFLKCVSLAANLGHPPRGITTVNMDFIQHYRPTQNVLLRPTAAGSSKAGRSSSRGYALTGHHEIMIPLLAAALKEQ